jgi:hypothetical protein
MIKIAPAILVVILVSACNDDECKQSDRCTLKPEVGNCKAAINKYYFDQSTGKCMVFSWSGCDGVVPFDNLKECEDQCDCKGKEY